MGTYLFWCISKPNSAAMLSCIKHFMFWLLIIEPWVIGALIGSLGPHLVHSCMIHMSTSLYSRAQTDNLTRHSRKRLFVTNNIKDGSVPFRSVCKPACTIPIPLKGMQPLLTDLNDTCVLQVDRSCRCYCRWGHVQLKDNLTAVSEAPRVFLRVRKHWICTFTSQLIDVQQLHSVLRWLHVVKMGQAVTTI